MGWQCYLQGRACAHQSRERYGLLGRAVVTLHRRTSKIGAAFDRPDPVLRPWHQEGSQNKAVEKILVALMPEQVCMILESLQRMVS